MQTHLFQRGTSFQKPKDFTEQPIYTYYKYTIGGASTRHAANPS